MRCSATTLLNDARSVLVGAYPYKTRYSREYRGQGQGYISPFAQAPDYHILVKSKLEALGEYIGQIYPETRYISQVDSGPACERLYALRAGIGWQGKNNFIIVPGYGSFVWLGLLATNLELPIDQPMDSLCGDCDRCLTGCPTGAYTEANIFDYHRCMAFWAADKRELTPEQGATLGKYGIIYGCDFCQLACPHNLPGEGKGNWPDLRDLLQMSREEFAAVFKDTAAAWRGQDILMRNVIFAAADNPKFRDVLEELAQGEGAAASLARRFIKEFSCRDE